MLDIIRNDWVKPFEVLGHGLLIMFFFALFYNGLVSYEPFLVLITLWVLLAKFIFRMNVGLMGRAYAGWRIVLLFYVLMVFLPLGLHATAENSQETLAFVSKYSKVLYLLPFFFMVAYLRMSIKDFNRFAMVLAYLIILISCYEIYVRFDSDFGSASNRLGELYSERGEVAWFIGSVLIGLVAAGLTERFYGRPAKHYLLLAAVLAILILLTATRSYWLSLSIAGIVSLPFLLLFFKQTMTQKMLVSSGVVILLLGVSTFVIDNPIKSRFQQATVDFNKIVDGDLSGSVGQRIFMAQVAVDGIKQMPWQGLGEQNFLAYKERLFQEHQSDSNAFLYQQIISYQHIHNQFLMDYWMKGILGLLALLGILLSSFWIFRRGVVYSIPESFMFNLGSIAFLVSSIVFFLFGAVLTYSHGIVFFTFWLTLLVLISLRSYEENSHS